MDLTGTNTASLCIEELLFLEKAITSKIFSWYFSFVAPGSEYTPNEIK